MQVQSATDPPKKLALGERAMMADGSEYNRCSSRRRATDRDRLSGRRHADDVGPNAIFKNAPNPERRAAVAELHVHGRRPAALIDVGGMHSVHPQTKEKPGRKRCRTSS
jgi:iron(III) transport system substrate-binding protein